MKKQWVFILYLFFAYPSFAATVYTSTISGTVYYDASATACSDVTAGDTSGDLEAAATAAGAGGTLYICEGTYSGTEIDAADGLDITGNLSIIGVGDRDNVVIDGSSLTDDVVNVGAGIVTIQNLTIQGADSTKYGIKTVATTTIIDVHLKDNACGLHHLTTGNITATRLEISGSTENNGMNLALTSASDTFNYCLFRDGNFYITFTAATTAVFNNCIFTNLNPSGFGVLYNGAGLASDVTLNNCVFWANQMDSNSLFAIFTWNAGTWTLNNTFITSNFKKYNIMIYNTGGATVTQNNTITSEPSPNWKTDGGKGIAYFVIEYATNEEHWEDITDVANTIYSLPTNIALSVGDTSGWTATEWSRLSGYLDGSTTGIENGLANIGYSGVNVYTTAGDDAAGTVNAITANKAGSTITVTVTRTDVDDSSTWSGTLQLDALGALDLTNSSYDEMDEIVAYLDGQGVTVFNASGQIAHDNALFFPKSIALKAGVYNINTTQTLVFDQHSLFVTEMKDSKTTIEAAIDPYISGFTINSFVWSNGAYGDNAVTYAMDTIGYDQVMSERASGETYKTAAMYLYGTGSISAPVDISTSDPGGQAELYFSVLTHFIAVGGIYAEGASDYSVANWTLIFAAAAKTSNLAVMTYDDAFDWVRANDDHVTNHISYRCSDNTEDCIIDEFNYRPKTNSSLINAGVDVSLTEDFNESKVPVGLYPDIGLYEISFGMDPIMLNFFDVLFWL